MRKFLQIANVFGLILMVFSLTLVLPIITSHIFDDGLEFDFMVDMTVILTAGFLMWRLTRPYEAELKPRDGFLLVAMTWVGMAAFATLPLMSYLKNLSFTDAFFETMSGLSTTGATVLVGLDNLPQSINLWRHELVWMGGMGIIVLTVAILPLLGIGGRALYKAETPGPMKDSKLTPRITQTAKNLWLVYFGITLACILSLRVVGMSWFDAICHAFATMGLGGFSTHDASVGYFNSPAIEFVLIVFMLIAGMNFATHFLAWRDRSARPYREDPEVLPFLLIILGSCALCALYLVLRGTYGDYLTALRHVSFNLVSLATDCGFVSVDYDKWPAFVPLWMLFLSCICACSGSTGGGIKMMRTLLLSKQALREMSALIHPAMVNPVKVGGAVVSNQIVFSVLGFIFLYFMSVVVLTFLLLAGGLDFTSSFSAIIACINNAGPGLNVVGPANNYQSLSDFQTWVCALAMLLGRLEIFTLLILFTPDFWRK